MVEVLGMNAVLFGMEAANVLLGATNVGLGIANHSQIKKIKNDTHYLRENALTEDTAKEMFTATQRAIASTSDKLGQQIAYGAMGVPTQEYHGRIIPADEEKLTRRLERNKSFNELDSLEYELLEIREENKALKKMCKELNTRASILNAAGSPIIVEKEPTSSAPIISDAQLTALASTLSAAIVKAMADVDKS